MQETKQWEWNAELTGKSISNGPLIGESAAKVCIPAAGRDVACNIFGGLLGFGITANQASKSRMTSTINHK